MPHPQSFIIISLFTSSTFQNRKSKNKGVLIKSFLAEEFSKRREHLTVNLVVWH